MAEALPTQDYSYLDRVDVTSTTNGGEDLFSEEIIEETEEEGANLEKQDSAVPRKPNGMLHMPTRLSVFSPFTCKKRYLINMVTLLQNGFKLVKTLVPSLNSMRRSRPTKTARQGC